MSNFRQIGLAFHQHDDQKAALPTNGRWDGVQTIPAAGGGAAFTPFTNDYATTTYQWGVGDAARVPREQTGSWLFALLPFVEQEAVWNDRQWWSPVPLYVCRSRRSPQALVPLAGDAYGEYGGGGWEWAKTDYAGNGYIVRGSVQNRNPRTLRLTNIADGTSGTVLAGEKAFNPLVQTPRSWYFDEPFQYDLRRGVADQPALVPTGSGASEALRTDGQGLRITLDANRPQMDPVGVRTRFGVRGDFDITATCQVGKMDRPTKGIGAGARLYLRFDSPDRKVSLSRVVRVKEGDSFLAYHVHTPRGGKQQDTFRVSEAKSAGARLRLVRTGTALSFQVAEDAGDFLELQSVDVGRGDVLDVWLTATTGGDRCAVDVRWGELRIEAAQLPSQVGLAARSRRAWWLAVLVGIGILGGSAAALSFGWGRPLLKRLFNAS